MAQRRGRQAEQQSGQIAMHPRVVGKRYGGSREVVAGTHGAGSEGILEGKRGLAGSIGKRGDRVFRNGMADQGGRLARKTANGQNLSKPYRHC